MSVLLVKASATSIPLPDDSVQCVVTSPPYWGLRKYDGEQELVWGGREDCEHDYQVTAVGNTRALQQGNKFWNNDPHPGGKISPNVKVPLGCTCIKCGAWRGAFGLEPTVKMYVEHTIDILREIRRVLRPDGVCFWNIGDSYAANNRGSGGHSKKQDSNRGSWTPGNHRNELSDGLKPKDLCLIPHRVALAAQDDGWWVRSDIIWAKPNPMPESCKDRPTDAYEHILMLTKSARYFWDADAVSEPALVGYRSTSFLPISAKDRQSLSPTAATAASMNNRTEEFVSTRNLRNVWTFPTQPYPGAHFATFPEELPRRCIRAASRRGDLVLDPFGGSGTTGRVAMELERRAVLLDLAYDAAYRDLAIGRTTDVAKKAA